MRRRLLSSALMSLVMLNAQAADVKVEWQDLSKFTDVRPSNETKLDFQARLVKEFDEIFASLGKRLPDNYTLSIHVNDLDLAGDVRPFFHSSLHDIRVMREIYWPRMNFDYELKDAQGNSVAKASASLSDMAYLNRINFAHNSEFKYEEQMLRDWLFKLQREKIFPVIEKAQASEK